MFKDGDLVVEIKSEIIYVFSGYYNVKFFNEFDCVAYLSKYDDSAHYGIKLFKSTDFWFYNKRHILVEKTRKIKTMK